MLITPSTPSTKSAYRQNPGVLMDREHTGKKYGSTGLYAAGTANGVVLRHASTAATTGVGSIASPPRG